MDNFFAPGDYNAACSMCGRKRKASMLTKNWQGLWRCPEHNEPRQPQDFVRGVREVITVPWSQRQVDTLVYLCTFNGQSAVPAYAMPGCSVPGRSNISPEENIYYY
jgi:hypothetical protein